MHRFSEYIIKRSTDFFSAGVGYDAEATILAAAFHDREKGLAGGGARLWQVVELLDLREADIDYGLSFAAGIQHCGKLVQGLGAEYDIDIRCPFTDGGSFLACNAATDGNF